MLTSKLNLESWLNAHCSKVERVGKEVVFTHSKTNSSILLPRDEWRDDLLQVEIEPLASFYKEYFGASIGNSQLTFATNIEGGVDVSHRFRLPDFYQMTAEARDMGLSFTDSEHVFLCEAGWMFFYTMSNENGQSILRKYDRDFGTCQIVVSMNVVLENWWKIVNQIHCHPISRKI